MLGRTLFFSMAAIAIGLAVAAPDDDDGDRSFRPIDGATSDSEHAAGDWYAGGHTLTREWDGHFYAEADVDGAPIRMMVDTGASVIALTADDAIAAGLDWNDDEVRRIGTGASGAVYGVPATLNEVEIGGLVRSNVRAVIIPEGLDISLLGQSYLSKIGNVAIEDNTMVLGG